MARPAGSIASPYEEKRCTHATMLNCAELSSSLAGAGVYPYVIQIFALLIELWLALLPETCVAIFKTLLAPASC